MSLTSNMTDENLHKLAAEIADRDPYCDGMVVTEKSAANTRWWSEQNPGRYVLDFAVAHLALLQRVRELEEGPGEALEIARRRGLGEFLPGDAHALAALRSLPARRES